MKAGTIKRPKLADLRAHLTKEQKDLLDRFWRHFQEKGSWPPARVIYSPGRRKMVREVLSPLTGNVVREERGQTGKPVFALGLLGVLLTSEGPDLEKLLASYLNFQHELFREHPEKESFESEDLMRASHMSKEDSIRLRQLIEIRNRNWDHAARPQPEWTDQALTETEEWEGRDLAQVFEEWMMPYYDPKSAVFEDDRRNQTISTTFRPPRTLVEHLPGLWSHEQRMDSPGDGDRLQRRHQVFVSSTYRDLVDERESVLRALLEMNCIPSAMELFPASDDAKWDLIRRLIDACDYFVVVVAGKYGWVAPDGRSYTEMEYDHALSTQKPIMGFYYSDIAKLPGERLESTDEGRRKLNLFHSHPTD
jgi:uncharacterized protein DUF4062